MKPSSPLFRAFTIVTAGLLAVIAACWGWTENDPRPNLVLVLVDTLRSDHLSVAGYPLATSPQLARLAERGTFFERFYAHSAVTRPSVATLLTSRYISGHLITNQTSAGLSAALPFLPEILARAGYRTAAFVTNPQIHPLLGFARGFDHFERFYDQDADPMLVRPEHVIKLPAHEVFAAVRRNVEKDGRRPFFAYVHLLDPHGPYQPPAADLARFADPDYDGMITGSVKDFARLERFRDHPADLAHFRALYDAEVSSTDRALGELVDWLDATDQMANTHLVITADHGEEFMEHGGTGHSLELYDESVRVPLLWIGPGIPRGRRVDRLAGLVDVVPTLLDVLDIALPEVEFQGRSLRPLWEEEPRPAGWRPALFLEGLGEGPAGSREPGVARGLVTETHKILATGCVVGRPGCDSFEIFDLIDDPGEQDGRRVTADDPALSPEERQLLRLYQRQEAQALRLAPSSGLQAELPPEDLERLKSLGYVDP